MNELSPDQYQAIKEFAKELTECFLNYKRTHDEEFSNIVLNYAINIIDIHLKLAELEVARYLNNLEKAVKKT